MNNQKSPKIGLDVLMLIFLAAGIAVGAVVSFNMDLSGIAAPLANSALDLGIDWRKAFVCGFIGSASFVAAAFLMGFCAVSQPFELLLVAFRGLGLGVLARSIYSCDDILMGLMLFLPGAVISCGILILQSCRAVQMSTRYLMLSVTSENRLGLAKEFRDYIFWFLIRLLACALVSAMEIALRLLIVRC